MSSAAETKMEIGPHLRTLVVDSMGAPSDYIETGAALRLQAMNLGIVSFQAKMITIVIGATVTNDSDQKQWSVYLLLPASPGAKTTPDQQDTKLKVTKAGQKVGFRSVGELYDIMADIETSSSGYYTSEPLDVFATTK